MLDQSDYFYIKFQNFCYFSSFSKGLRNFSITESFCQAGTLLHHFQKSPTIADNGSEKVSKFTVIEVTARIIRILQSEYRMLKGIFKNHGEIYMPYLFTNALSYNRLAEMMATAEHNLNLPTKYAGFSIKPKYTFI